MKEFTKDKLVQNLYLRTTPSGAKSYVFRYGLAGRRYNLTLGAYGSITLSQARTEARKHIQTLASGGKPETRASSVRGKPTMVDLFADWKREIGSAKKSAKEDDRMWSKYCCRLHNIYVHEVRKIDITSTLDAIKAPTQSNRVQALLSTLCNFAKNSDEYDLSHNPCDGLRRNKERKRDRLLSQDEIQRFFATIEKYRDSRRDAAAFLLLLAHTGARKSEISNMRWQDIRGTYVELSAHKTDRTGKSRIIQLSSMAQEIIRSLPRGGAPEDYVLGVRNPRALFDLVCKEAGIDDFRIHDIRHLYASIAAMSGMSLLEIGHLLGHTNQQTTLRYAHLCPDQLNDTAEKISRQLAIPTLAAK